MACLAKTRATRRRDTDERDLP